jgi:hypothetical protein
MRHKEVKQLAQGHTARKGRNEIPTQGLSLRSPGSLRWDVGAWSALKGTRDVAQLVKCLSSKPKPWAQSLVPPKTNTKNTEVLHNLSTVHTKPANIQCTDFPTQLKCLTNACCLHLLYLKKEMYCNFYIKLFKIHEIEAGDAAWWQGNCLACVRLWIRCPLLEKKKKEAPRWRSKMPTILTMWEAEAAGWRIFW